LKVRKRGVSPPAAERGGATFADVLLSRAREKGEREEKSPHRKLMVAEVGGETGKMISHKIAGWFFATPAEGGEEKGKRKGRDMFEN